MEPETKSQLRMASSVGAVGLEMGIAVCLGFFFGHLLDTAFDTGFIQYIGLAFGVAAGFLGLFRAAKRMEKMSESDSQEAHGTPTSSTETD